MLVSGSAAASAKPIDFGLRPTRRSSTAWNSALDPRIQLAGVVDLISDFEPADRGSFAHHDTRGVPTKHARFRASFSRQQS
jgi:hypothetical protein